MHIVLRKGKIEPGLNLANQVCRWKDELILVELNIKITGTDARFASGKQNNNGTILRLIARCHLECNKKLSYCTPTEQQSTWK